MAREPRADLDSLRIVVSQLNNVLAEASGIVQDVDRFLSDEFDIGVWAISRPFDSQRVSGEDGRDYLVTTHLAYGKVAGRSRLHVLTATLDKNDAGDQYTQILSEERTPWPLCPREVKLHSFAMLPELLGTLALKAEEIAAQTSRTSQTVRDLLAAMGRLDPTDDEAEPAIVNREEALDFNLFKRPRARSA